MTAILFFFSKLLVRMHPFGQPSICVVQLSFTALRCQTWRRFSATRNAGEFARPKIMDVRRTAMVFPKSWCFKTFRKLVNEITGPGWPLRQVFNTEDCFLSTLNLHDVCYTSCFPSHDTNPNPGLKKWGMKASPLTDMIPATPLPLLWRIWSKAGGTKETVTCLVRQAFQDTLATSTELK